MDGFNNYDYFIMSFLVITTIFGFARGLSGEVCSFVKIVIASIITAVSVVVIGEKYFQNNSGITASIVLTIVPGIIFFLSNTILGMLLFPVKEFIRVMMPFALDRILGVFVALIKNVFVIVLLHAVFVIFIPNYTGKDLKWAEKAELSGVLTPLAETLVSQKFFKDKLKEQFGKGDKNKGSSSGSGGKSDSSEMLDSAKALYNSLLKNSSKEVDKVDGAGEVVDDAEDGKDEVIDKVKDLVKMFGSKEDSDSDISNSGDAVSDNVSDINTDELKDLIDRLNK